MLIKTNLFIPKRFAAYTFAFVIFIRPQHANNQSLIAHERVHVRQFFRTVGLHALLYAVSKGYRYKAELEAHRVEYWMAPNRLDTLASNLCSKYGLEVSFAKARSDIMESSDT